VSRRSVGLRVYQGGCSFGTGLRQILPMRRGEPSVVIVFRQALVFHSMRRHIPPMKDPFFFGYGSLVNRRTHHYEQAQTASVRGWRRAWRHSPLRPVSFLTVVPAVDDHIDGLIAAVPGADWQALDERERAYARHQVSHDVSHSVQRDLDVAIYAIPDGHHHPPGDDNPVLLSYLDVVVQGFLAEFGPQGAHHFFETTEGWHAPVLDDRHAPIYPRHQRLSAEETALVDEHLSRLPTVVKKLD